MNTLEQTYAGAVYKKVEAFGDKYPKGKPERDQYGSMAHKLPILIRTAGLAEALAFVESRNKPAHHALLEDLAQVLGEKDMETLGKRSRSAEMQDYVFLSRRAMLALKWFKRFAQSVLDVDPTAEGG